MSDSGIRPDDQRRRPSGVRSGSPANAIQASHPHPPSAAPPPGKSCPGLRRLLLVASGLGLAAALACAIVLAWPRPREPLAVLPGQGLTKSLAFSPDGAMLAGGCRDRWSGKLVVWDVGSRQERLSLPLEQWGN